MAILHVNESEFDREVLQDSGTVLVDFWATWCGPCKVIGPILEKLETAYEGRFRRVKIDSDQEQELAAAFGITSVPTLLFAPAEGEPRLAVGALPKAQLEKAVKEVLRVE